MHGTHIDRDVPIESHENNLMTDGRQVRYYPYLIDLAPHAVDVVRVGVVGVVVHPLAQNPGEVVVHGVSERGERGAAVRLDEPPVDVREERERDPAWTNERTNTSYQS
jgi:hypothetical protein